MAIKTIRVKNFKSFKDVEIQLGNFNVLIGANASGKSNFIHIIEFLRDIQRHGLENAISLQGGPEYLTNLNIGPRENLFMEVVTSEEPCIGLPLVVGRSQNRDIDLEFAQSESHYSFVVAFSEDRAGINILDEYLCVRGSFTAYERINGARHPLG